MVGEKISSGASGQLFRGQLIDPDLARRHNTSEVAIKKIVPGDQEFVESELFRREVAVLWSLTFQPNIINLIGFCETPVRCLITKLYERDLASVLHDEPQEPLSIDQMVWCAVSIGTTSISHIFL